jgi:hypothetical protein
VIEWYTDNMKQTIIEAEKWNIASKTTLKVGQFIKVKIIEAIPFKLYGKIAKEQ